MHFGVNLSYLESFKGRVPEKTKMTKNLYNQKITLPDKLNPELNSKERF